MYCLFKHLSLFFALIFFYPPTVWALEFIEVGNKHQLKRENTYHFSAEDLISVHLNTSRPFIIGLKIGDLVFKENNRQQRILILNKEQSLYFQKTRYIVEASPFLKWSVKKQKLRVSGKCTNKECDILLSSCTALNATSVVVASAALIKDINTPAGSTSVANRCLGLKPSYLLNLAFLNENSLSGKTYGLGVPSELLWTFNKKLSLNEVTGNLNAGGQKSRSSGHTFFSSLIHGDQPSVFESGSEVLIKPSGILNLQKNEWKKASSQIEVVVNNVNNSYVSTNLKINRTERTGSSQVFNIERLEKNLNLKSGEWTQIALLRYESTASSKSSPLSLSFLGNNNKSAGQTYKQIWVRIVRN